MSNRFYIIVSCYFVVKTRNAPEKMQTTVVLLILALTCYVYASVTVATAYVSGQGAWTVQVGKEDLQGGVAVASKKYS